MSGYFSHAYFIPEIILIVTAIGILAFISINKLSAGREHTIAISGLITALIVHFIFRPFGLHGIFSNLLIRDAYGQFIKVSILLMSGIILIFFRQNPESSSKQASGRFVPILILIIAGCIMGTANHLVELFMALQLIDITGFLIAKIENDNQNAILTAWKDMIFNLITSMLMLMGIGLMYRITGSFFISEISKNLTTLVQLNFPIIFSVVLILFGFTHSISGIFRLHWRLKIYQAIPVPNRLLLLTIPQFVEIAALIRFLSVGLAQISDVRVISLALGLFAIITLIYPTFLLIKTHDSINIIGLTSMTQVGFGLLAMSTLSPAGNVAVLFHQLVFIINLIAISTIELTSASDQGHVRPVQIIFLASLIGIPLTIGFPAKYRVLSNLVRPEAWYYFLLVIGIGAAAGLFIGFTRLLRQDSIYPSHAFRLPEPAPKTMNVLRITLLLIIIGGGIFWTPLTNYIQSVVTFHIP